MKSFIIFLFWLLAVQFANAQISTNIGGLNIGQTNLYDGLKIIKNVDNDCLYYDSNNKIEVSANNFPFGGINWNDIIVSFENSLLVRVQLNAEGYPSTSSVNMFKKLNDAYLNKYKDYLVYSSPYAYMYKDDYVSVLLSFNEDDSSITITYTYEYTPKIGDGI